LLNKQPEAITHEDKLTVLFIFSELAKLAIGNAKNFQSTPKVEQKYFIFVSWIFSLTDETSS